MLRDSEFAPVVGTTYVTNRETGLGESQGCAKDDRGTLVEGTRVKVTRVEGSRCHVIKADEVMRHGWVWVECLSPVEG